MKLVVSIVVFCVLAIPLRAKDCPLAPTGPAEQTFCSGTKVSNLSASGTNIKWYDSPTAGSLYSPDAYLQDRTNGYTYYASQTVNGCESSERLRVFVNLNYTRPAAPGFPFTTTFRAIASNTFDNIALKTDGTLWTWGWNNAGQLGDGTKTDQFAPIQIGIGNQWEKVTAGFLSSFAIRNDGTLWSWGDNQHGQLGDGTTLSRSVPTQVGSASNWKSISTQYNFVIALKTDGTLWAWGNNQKGQLGNGTLNNQPAPIQIGTDMDWVAVSSGLQHSLALKANGTLWAWGGDYYNQLGDGDVTLVNKKNPVQIGTDTNWKSIHASSFSSFAIKTNGTLWGWGSNVVGQLGIGSPSHNKIIPTQIGTENHWVVVAPIGSDRFHNIAIKSDGTLWSWGYNQYGELGNGTTAEAYTYLPTKVGNGTNWASVSVGDDISVAIKKDGSVWEWGNLDYSYSDVYQSASTSVPTFINPPNGLALQSYCSTLTVSDLFATGTDIKWYPSSDGESSLSTSLPLQNEMHYYATQTVNHCESESRLHAVALVNPVETPVPKGPSSQNFCEGATVSNLVAIGFNLRWYLSPSGGDTLTFITPLIHNQHYYVSQGSPGCSSAPESPRLEVLVTLENASPAPTGDENQNFCEGATVSSLVAIGYNLRWYLSPSGGDNLTFTTPLIHNQHYYVSQASAGCSSATESPRLDVLVTLENASPAPKGAENQNFCGPTLLTKLTATGSSIRWYSVITGGTPLPANTLLVDKAHYYASQTSGNCESTERLTITAHVNAVPAPPIGEATQTLLSGETIADLVLSGNDIKWYSTKENAIAHTPKLSESTLLQMGELYFATQTVSNCESPAFAVSIVLITEAEPISQGLSVYPNPVSGTLRVYLNETIDNITVSDVMAHRLIDKEINSMNADLNLSDLASGIYLVQLKVKHKLILVRIVKE